MHNMDDLFWKNARGSQTQEGCITSSLHAGVNMEIKEGIWVML